MFLHTVIRGRTWAVVAQGVQTGGAVQCVTCVGCSCRLKLQGLLCPCMHEPLPVIPVLCYCRSEVQCSAMPLLVATAPLPGADAGHAPQQTFASVYLTADVPTTHLYTHLSSSPMSTEQGGCLALVNSVCQSEPGCRHSRNLVAQGHCHWCHAEGDWIVHEI